MAVPRSTLTPGAGAPGRARGAGFRPRRGRPGAVTARHLQRVIDTVGVAPDRLGERASAAATTCRSSAGSAAYPRELLDRARRQPRRAGWSSTGRTRPRSSRRARTALLRWRMARAADEALGRHGPDRRATAAGAARRGAGAGGRLTDRSPPPRSSSCSATSARATAGRTGAGTGRTSSARWSSCSGPARSPRPAAPRSSSAGTTLPGARAAGRRWSRRRTRPATTRAASWCAIAARAHGVATERVPARLLPAPRRRRPAGDRRPGRGRRAAPGDGAPAGDAAGLPAPRRPGCRAGCGPRAAEPVRLRWSGSGPAPRRCSGSATASRSTPRPPRGCTATTCCRSCSTTGSSPGSTSRPSAARGQDRACRRCDGVLRVKAAWAEPGPTRRIAAELAAELAEMADWLGAGRGAGRAARRPGGRRWRAAVAGARCGRVSRARAASGSGSADQPGVQVLVGPAPVHRVAHRLAHHALGRYPARRATPHERSFSTAWYSSIRCQLQPVEARPGRQPQRRRRRSRARAPRASSQYPTDPEPRFSVDQRRSDRPDDLPAGVRHRPRRARAVVQSRTQPCTACRVRACSSSSTAGVVTHQRVALREHQPGGVLRPPGAQLQPRRRRVSRRRACSTVRTASSVRAPAGRKPDAGRSGCLVDVAAPRRPGRSPAGRSPALTATLADAALRCVHHAARPGPARARPPSGSSACRAASRTAAVATPRPRRPGAPVADLALRRRSSSRNSADLRPASRSSAASGPPSTPPARRRARADLAGGARARPASVYGAGSWSSQCAVCASRHASTSRGGRSPGAGAAPPRLAVQQRRDVPRVRRRQLVAAAEAADPAVHPLAAVLEQARTVPSTRKPTDQATRRLAQLPTCACQSTTSEPELSNAQAAAARAPAG